VAICGKDSGQPHAHLLPLPNGLAISRELAGCMAWLGGASA
jgi:hypothetical protein